jgi:uncharacterized MAPEG superfamily protein
MTLAHWCLLTIVIAPYLLSVLARSEVRRSDYVQDPRAYSESLEGWHRRAHLAHLNAFEAIPVFLAGLFVAQAAAVPQGRVDLLALAFVLCRLLHALLYIVDRPMLRSHAWRLGMICVLAMFVLAAMHG